MPIWLAANGKREESSQQGMTRSERIIKARTDVVPVELGAEVLNKEVLERGSHAVDAVSHVLDLTEPVQDSRRAGIVSQLARTGQVGTGSKVRTTAGRGQRRRGWCQRSWHREREGSSTWVGR